MNDLLEYLDSLYPFDMSDDELCRSNEDDEDDDNSTTYEEALLDASRESQSGYFESHIPYQIETDTINSYEDDSQSSIFSSDCDVTNDSEQSQQGHKINVIQ